MSFTCPTQQVSLVWAGSVFDKYCSYPHLKRLISWSIIKGWERMGLFFMVLFTPNPHLIVRLEENWFCGEKNTLYFYTLAGWTPGTWNVGLPSMIWGHSLNPVWIEFSMHGTSQSYLNQNTYCQAITCCQRLRSITSCACSRVVMATDWIAKELGSYSHD